jgi:hypothetical protein
LAFSLFTLRLNGKRKCHVFPVIVLPGVFAAATGLARQQSGKLLRFHVSPFRKLE